VNVAEEGPLCIAVATGKKDHSVRGGLACGAVGHVGHLFAGGFHIRVEFQCVLDESAILLVLAPERDDVTAFSELSTCEGAVGERLFELLPRLDIVGRLPLLDLLGDRGQFVPQLLARVLLDERADLLEELARVVRLVARGLAGRDAAQLALVGERLEFLVGRAPGGVGLFADPVDRPRFAQRLSRLLEYGRGRSSTQSTTGPHLARIRTCLAPLDTVLALYSQICLYSLG